MFSDKNYRFSLPSYTSFICLCVTADSHVISNTTRVAKTKNKIKRPVGPVFNIDTP